MKKSAKPVGLPSIPLSHSLLSVVLAFLLSGCGRTIDWKQEVKLHDGRTIVLERRSKQVDMQLPTKGTLETWQQIAFTQPNTGRKIQWEVPKGLGIFSLDFNGSTTWIVLKPMSVADYNNWKCPNPPWVVFQMENDVWQQHSIENLPISLGRRNTLPAAASDQIYSDGKFINVDRFDSYLARLDQAQRIISREKINPIAHGCHEGVLHLQGRQSEIDTGR